MLPNTTITVRKMRDFTSLYDTGHYRQQRFGQAFCNHFDILYSPLFYTTSRKEAEYYIYNNLIN